MDGLNRRKTKLREMSLMRLNVFCRGVMGEPVCLQTDKGKEFISDVMQRNLANHRITYRVARRPDTKAAIVERFIRTIKERKWRYFTHKNTRRYIDVLQKIIEASH